MTPFCSCALSGAEAATRANADDAAGFTCACGVALLMELFAAPWAEFRDASSGGGSAPVLCAGYANVVKHVSPMRCGKPDAWGRRAFLTSVDQTEAVLVGLASSAAVRGVVRVVCVVVVGLRVTVGRCGPCGRGRIGL